MLAIASGRARGRARAFAWLRRISLLVLATLVFTPLVVQAAWYDNNWQYRKKITIDFTKVTANLTNFPVLINLATDAELMANARADGFDILFTDDDETTKLDHERELYVSATGELVAWVRIPSLPSTVDKVIYIYYGNPGALDQQNAPGVWDTNYKLVQHLQEGDSTVTDFYKDSTSNDNHGTLTDADGDSAAATKIDGAFDFEGDADRIAVPNSASLNPTTDKLTISLWMNPDTDTNNQNGGIAKGDLSNA
ncbi:MAG: DUF2341 domain-containing protein, partial [Proteobacteria bacterium]|nr:DUF2341 domain-containing protein [Pseudomonadota bacterium]